MDAEETRLHEKENEIYQFFGKLGEDADDENINNVIRHYLKKPLEGNVTIKDYIPEKYRA